MEKDLYFQKLRGIAIIAVVLIHATGQSFTNEYMYNYYIGLILRQFINYAVPLFLFISGYFAYKSKNKSIVKKILRILIPYLIWSCIALIVFKRDQLFNIKYIVKVLLFGQAIGIYYYIIVLAQLIILTNIFIKVSKTSKCNYFYLITPMFIIIVYICNICNIEVIKSNYILLFITWFVFYYHGIMVAKDNKYAYGNLKLYLALIAASILEGFIWNANGNIDLAISQTKITSMIASLIFINLLIRYKKTIDSKLNRFFLVEVGNSSFGIYLFHMFILKYVQSVLNSIYILYKFQFINIILTTIITIYICKIVSFVFKKILGEKISKKIMGLE